MWLIQQAKTKKGNTDSGATYHTIITKVSCCPLPRPCWLLRPRGRPSPCSSREQLDSPRIASVDAWVGRSAEVAQARNQIVPNSLHPGQPIRLWVSVDPRPRQVLKPLTTDCEHVDHGQGEPGEMNCPRIIKMQIRFPWPRHILKCQINSSWVTMAWATPVILMESPPLWKSFSPGEG